MKYLIIFLLLSSTASAQLDTMLIRQPITMEAQHWAWLRGKVSATSDSAILKSDRNINLQLRATQNLQWATSVAIDSIPGKLVFAFYQVLRKNAGEVVSWYTSMNSALSGVTQLTQWITSYSAAIDADRAAAIAVGKYIYLDQ